MAGTLNEKDLEHLDKQTLITLLVSSNASNAALLRQVEQLTDSIELLNKEVKYLRSAIFGRSSEKEITDTMSGQQLCFAFNEAEVTIDLDPDIPEPEFEEICPKTYRRTKQKGKREADLKDLKTTVVTHELTEAELLEKFSRGKWKQLPDQIYKRLEFHPACFEVIEHHVAVYAGDGDRKIIRAPRPADLLRNSIATPSLVAGIYNYKYVNAQPINRLAKEFENNGVFIPTQNMCRWAIEASDRYLKPLYDRLHGRLFDYHVIHADETPVNVVKDGRPAGSKSYMWVYRSGALEDHPFVLYQYQKTRNSEHPRQFLRDYKGYLVTDGYQAYHTIGSEREDLKVAGCYAHARRGFADVVKAAGKDSQTIKDTVAYKALQIIQTIYRYEKSYKGLDPEKRFEERKRSAAPLVDALFAYLKSSKESVAPKSRTGKAIAYCLNQEEYLRVFLEDGHIPIDNNAAERAIWTFCLGKKNWYTIDTIRGAQSSAVVYSIAETAKANNLRPYEYFKFLLEEIPKHGEFEDPAYLDDLLPWSDSLPDYCRKPEKSE